ncbi:MAG: ATP-binding protein [Pseudomonadota bacterium]|nr:ATP-binding protein [Pseudomonadota bacterium]
MPGRISYIVKRCLPKSLLGRSLLIIVMPLVLLQLVSGIIFFESHWDKVTLRLARSVAGDIAAIISLMRESPDSADHVRAFELAAAHMNMTATLEAAAVLPKEPPVGRDLMERMLIRALRDHVRKPFQIDTNSRPRHVVIDVQLTDNVLRIVTSRKRLFSTTAYVFVIWMIGTSLILFAVATIFMRNQVKPVSRLAVAADNLGKGREAPAFKPEGATEVRQAAAAFLVMQERISRQIAQRTDMLAGVSHDLRTPLTRMKLQLEMLGDEDAFLDLKSDITEMEHMLDGYLAFARGEGAEQQQPTNLSALLEETAAQARRKGSVIDLHTESDIMVSLRPAAFKRCVTNLVDNATRYAEHVSVHVGKRGDSVEITIDDDGPGITETERANVFSPFYRVEGSRNPGTGGVGLGLTIARDVIRGHGGDIGLSDSPNGGLRASVRIPL